MADLPPSRSVVREHLFEERLARLVPDPEVADEYVAAAEWLLALDAELGFPVRPGSAVWTLPMPPVDGEQVALFYTFDAEAVRLLAVEKA